MFISFQISGLRYLLAMQLGMFYGKYAHTFRSAYVNEKPKINCRGSELVL